MPLKSFLTRLIVASLYVAFFSCSAVSKQIFPFSERQFFAYDSFDLATDKPLACYTDDLGKKPPKGGQMRIGVDGSFDVINGALNNGSPVSGSELATPSLMIRTPYGKIVYCPYVAENFTIYPEEYKVMFRIKQKASWNDGSLIRATDILRSLEIFQEKGTFFEKQKYSSILKGEISDENIVTFYIDPSQDMEDALFNLFEMPVLREKCIFKKSYDNECGKSSSAGPYFISKVIMGQLVEYERIKNHWTKDIPFFFTRYNFDKLSFLYFRDESMMIRALRANEIDFRFENVAKYWSKGYLGSEKDLCKIKIKHSLPQGMQGFVINSRRYPLNKRKVRQAIAYVMDYEWINKNILFSTYNRSISHYPNSDMEVHGELSDNEKRLFHKLPEEADINLLKERPIVPSGGPKFRDYLSIASNLLMEEGFEIDKKGFLKDKDGNLLSIEILVTRSTFERIAFILADALKRLGIKVKIKQVEVAQYARKMRYFDFDITMATFPSSFFPGIEQRRYWHSEYADAPGSKNYSGVSNNNIDYLLKIITLGDKKDPETVAAIKLLDRLLLNEFYIIPQWHSEYFRIVVQKRIGVPKIYPLYGLDIESWWDREYEYKKIPTMECENYETY